MEHIDINWLCNHMKKVSSSQKQPSNHSCFELSKTHFFPMSSVKYVRQFSESYFTQNRNETVF